MEPVVSTSLWHRSWGWFKVRAVGPHALFWCGAYLFLVSSFLPLPSEPVLLLLFAANIASRRRVALLTGLATAAAALGAAAGYLSGAFFYDTFAGPIAQSVGFADEVAHLGASLNHFTFLATFVTALIPVPHPPFTIAAGLFHVDFITFLIAFVVGRAIHFVALALAITVFGVGIMPALRRLIARI